MGPGRPKKPTKVKKSQGTYRKDRDKGPEPEYKLIANKPPAFLNKKEKSEWKYLVSMLTDSGVAKASDAHALTMLAKDIVEYLTMSSKVEKDGNFIKSGERTEYAPWLIVRNQAWDRVYKMMGQFGLTPASRSKIIVERKKEKSKLEELMDM